VKTKNIETMRKANNNSNFTVEALVAKYRNFVEEHHAPKSNENIGVFSSPAHKYADHQLLIKLYESVAGDRADSYVIEGLSPYSKLFMVDALNADEISFLCDNFKNAVEYIFSGRLYGMSDFDWNSITEMKPEFNFVSVIGKQANSHSGIVYAEDDVMGDVAMQFPQGTIVLHDSETNWMSGFHTDQEENALKMIRFFASDILCKVVKDLKNEKFDTLIRKIAGGPWKHFGAVTFSSVNPNGQMF
jgi:hypothetical protein